MKKILLWLLVAACPALVQAQDITGTWNGMLKVPGTQLTLVFHINKTDQGFSSTMDSPDQGAFGLPVTETKFENGKLTLKITGPGIEYSGDWAEGRIKGNFMQAGYSFPLDLQREQIEKTVQKRPQEPVQPYPYRSEEVTFTNQAAGGITLAGTLTLPNGQGPFPVAVLVSGSGPQNRDEELLGHKPFLILSDYLTRQGIAVLRYDDRGTAASGGDFKTATTADFSGDAESAVKWLKTRKEIDPKKIGIIGHSEGGVIAPMVAARCKDVAFIVMMAGTGMKGSDLLLLQQELIGRASGMTEEVLKTTREINQEAFSLIDKQKDTAALRVSMTQFLEKTVAGSPADMKPAGLSDKDIVDMQLSQLLNPWMIYFLRYDPVPALKRVKCPVLALNGEKDLQVAAKENLEAIGKALKGNKKATLIEYPGMNHLFQSCTTGSPDEYSTIQTTIEPKVLGDIAQWILKL